MPRVGIKLHMTPAEAGIHHECAQGSSGHNGYPFHVRMGATALGVMVPEALLQGCGQGTCPRWDLRIFDPRYAVGHISALDPAVGRERATMLLSCFWYPTSVSAPPLLPHR